MYDNFNNDYYRNDFNRSCQNSYPREMNFGGFEEQFDFDDRQEFSGNYYNNWNNCCQRLKPEHNNCRPQKCNCNRCNNNTRRCCFHIFKCC